MPVLTEFPARRRAEIGAIARAVEEESDRLCAIIDTARNNRDREQALEELQQLAANILICLETLESRSERITASESYDLPFVNAA